MIKDIDCLYITGVGFIAQVTDIPSDISESDLDKLLLLSGIDMSLWGKYSHRFGSGDLTCSRYNRGVTLQQHFNTPGIGSIIDKFSGTWLQFNKRYRYLLHTQHGDFEAT